MKSGTQDHPKVWISCKAAGVRRPSLLGHLELLWDFAAKYAPQGDIGRYGDDRIEAAMDWPGRKGKLLDALVQGGWVERHKQYRLVIHDWHEHCTEGVRKKLIRHHLEFVALSKGYKEGVETISGQCLPNPISVPDTVRHTPCLTSIADPEPLPQPDIVPTTPLPKRSEPPIEFPSFDFPRWFTKLLKLWPIPRYPQQAQQELSTLPGIDNPEFRIQVEANVTAWALYYCQPFIPKKPCLFEHIQETGKFHTWDARPQMETERESNTTRKVLEVMQNNASR